MKRILSALLVVALFFTLSACGKKEEKKPEKAEKKEPQQKSPEKKAAEKKEEKKEDKTDMRNGETPHLPFETSDYSHCIANGAEEETKCHLARQ